MARVIIDGEVDVVTVTTIENYTDDLIGVVTGLIFVRIIGTITRKKTAFNGSNFTEIFEEKPFDKIINVMNLREWII